MALRPAAAALAVTAMVLTGCGAGHPAASASPAATHVAPSPTVPAGCQEALLVVAAVRPLTGSHSPTMTNLSGIKRLESTARQVPVSQLRLDLTRAAADLALYNVQVTSREPAGKQARWFAADLGKITRECSPG